MLKSKLTSLGKKAVVAPDAPWQGWTKSSLSWLGTKVLRLDLFIF
jgi:hypothetical protein